MRLFHLAGCVVRAVRVVPMAAITSVIVTFALRQGGGQFTIPTAVQIPTIVGAFLGFLGLVGESSDNSD